MFVCCECCVLSGRGLCDALITRPEESYRLWCVVVCDLGNLMNEEVMAHWGLSCPNKQTNYFHLTWELISTQGSGFENHNTYGHIVTITELYWNPCKFERSFEASSFIHFVVCLTTGPKPLPKRVQLRVRYSASSFNFLYPIFSLRPSSSSFHTRESYSAELKRRIT